MNTGLLLLIITVAVALAFDFLNGFHDAANSIATVVSTRVLSPKLAVLWAAFFNFVAAFLLGTAVAKTIGKGMIRLDDVTQYVVIAGLAGAIVWDLLTWWWGLPTSSSHALIGGYAGAAMTRAALNHGVANAYSVILPHGWTLRYPPKSALESLSGVELTITTAARVSCNPDGHGSKSRIRAPEDPEPTARKGSPLVLRAWLSTIPFCFRNRTGVPCFVPGN